jgi:protein subunit release factor A
MQKTSSGIRIIHVASGAVGQATDTRSQNENRQIAFKRLAESDKFVRWVRAQAFDLEQRVEKALRPHNIKVEVKENGRWVEETIQDTKIL